MNVNELLEKIYIKAIEDKHTLQEKIKKKKKLVGFHMKTIDCSK